MDVASSSPWHACQPWRSPTDRKLRSPVLYKQKDRYRLNRRYATPATAAVWQLTRFFTWKRHRRKTLPCSAALPSSAAVAGAMAVAGEVLSDAAMSFMAAAAPCVFVASVCFAVMTLQHHSKISDGLCTVACQALCNLTAPALLLSTTLKAVPHLHPAMLLLLPFTAAQVALGWWLGGVSARLVAEGALFTRPLLGWHPHNPAASAEAIANSTARALGTPAAVSALTPKTPGTPEGLPQAVRAACAFGDPLLTPAAMLALLAPSPLPPQLAAWLAAHLAAWSLVYWGAAPFVAAGQATAATSTSSDWPFTGPALSLPHLLRRVSSRVRAELAPPPPPLQALPRGTSSRYLVDSEEAAQQLTPTAIYEAAKEGAPPSGGDLAAQRLARLWRAAACLGSLAVGNALALPPVAAIAVGLLLGSTQLCRTALQASPTHPPHLPWELHLALVTLRALLDAVEAVGRATAPLMAVAVGAALMESQAEVQLLGGWGRGAAAGQTWRSSAWRLLWAPLPPPQLRAAVAVALVRYGALPLLGALLLGGGGWVLRHLHATSWGATLAAARDGPWGPAVVWLLLASCVAPPTELLVALVGARLGAGSQLVSCLARLSLVWRLLGVLAAAAWGAVFMAVGGFHLL